ncbi:MAG: hypothetical protein Q7J47_07740 [Azoarcus sp.]|nr:hypothetical protein [Azoarcus sp.]
MGALKFLSFTPINDVVPEKRAVTPDTALRRLRDFDNTPEFWLNLQTADELKCAAINTA